MEEALAEGRIAVRFFAEQDFLNGYFKVGESGQGDGWLREGGEGWVEHGVMGIFA